MILETVHVKNFKCVRDSGEFRIDEKVTCLVGKNEAGKTALLQALHKLNPLDAEEGRFSELEYPRDAWCEYKERAAKEPADALVTVWRLEDDDVAELSKVLGPRALTSRRITVTKGYYEQSKWSVPLDDKAIVAHLLEGRELPAEVRQRLGASKTVKALQAELMAQKASSGAQDALLAHINAKFPDGSAWRAAVGILHTRLPRFVYIPEYFRMPGQVSIEDLKARQASGTLEPRHRVFLALLGLIGATAQDLEKIDRFEHLTAELEAASNRLSREIFRYWSQNRHLVVRFKFDAGLPGDPAPFNTGHIVRTRIENTRHFVTVGFDDCSAGFVWFFSFLVWFSQAKRHYGDNLVVLLDEPGLTLHARAQSDLLRYVEERLVPNYQVVYTAHSPFMIDPAQLPRARTVEDVYVETKEGETPPPRAALGTKVRDEVLSSDRDTVFPLQAALGFAITQTLFVGPHTLLVEGPAELLYFEWFKQKLRSLGRSTLDPRWVLAPCGGVDKIPAFLALFGGDRLHVAVFSDFAEATKKRVRELRESNLLKDGHVLSAEMYAAQAEADIEDLIGRDGYIELVARAYELQVRQRVPAARAADAPERVVKEVEAHFKTLTGVPEFDPYRPAEFLTLAGSREVARALDPALERFEGIFRDLNAMLG